MEILKPIITIDIWSDLVCPWCWIAKKRFEKGLAAFEHRDSVVIRHHGFRISGDRPPLPFREALYKKFGGQHDAELMMNQVETAGKLEGLQYNFDTMLFGDTENALTLLAAAHQEGMGDMMAERLYLAGTTEGRSIFDSSELIKLAEEVGMNASDARSALNNESLRASVHDDETYARSLGVSGVPLFLLNEKYAISGAQSAENFLSALLQVWDEKQEALLSTNGQTCGIDGCSI
ncbi:MULTISPECIES: DsbA family oxidoreductase [Morganellaceae]|uniref:DsbA family oxidoreductase n=1 Tax=Morganellaceae TaxID=1903414 RepID=UPI0018E4ABDE|nr:MULTISPECIES: DsbA family oxidoreductase [Morganellaceae]MBI6530063.1 DsbA family oxidoreductase [Proteus vulgaris]MBP6082212.1 DsbA family oxidoreductase [Providencia sp.]